MRLLVVAFSLVCAAMLAVFALAELYGPRLLEDPSVYLGAASVAAATLGVSLLAADVVLPVPASIVMTLLGAAFGPLWGALLATVGSLASFGLGLLLGRSGRSALRRLVPPSELERAAALVARWGLLAIVLTRTLPILAEATAIAVGASSPRVRDPRLAALAGTLPVALVYAAAGSLISGIRASVVIFVALVVVAGVSWMISRRLLAQTSERLPAVPLSEEAGRTKERSKSAR